MTTRKNPAEQGIADVQIARTTSVENGIAADIRTDLLQNLPRTIADVCAHDAAVDAAALELTKVLVRAVDNHQNVSPAQNQAIATAHENMIRIVSNPKAGR